MQAGRCLLGTTRASREDPSAQRRGARSPSLVCGPSKLNTLTGSPCLYGGRGAGRAMPSRDHAAGANYEGVWEQRRGARLPSLVCGPSKLNTLTGSCRLSGGRWCRPGDAFSGPRRWF